MVLLINPGAKLLNSTFTYTYIILLCPIFPSVINLLP